MARDVGSMNLLGTFTCGNCQEKITNATAGELAEHLASHARPGSTDHALDELRKAAACTCPADDVAAGKHRPGSWCELRPAVDMLAAELDGLRPIAAAARRYWTRGRAHEAALMAAVENYERRCNERGVVPPA